VQTQLDGEHSFFKRKLKLTWAGDYNKTSRTNPDDRFVIANVREAKNQFPSSDGNYLFHWLPPLGPSQPFLSSQFTMHNRLDETKKNAGANAEYSFQLLDREQKLKAGFLHSERRADYEQIYLHTYINTQHEQYPLLDGTSLVEVYNPANFESGALYYKVTGYDNRQIDYYKGNQTIDAFYLMGEIIPLKPLRIIGGVRKEDAETTVSAVVSEYDATGKLFNIVDTITRPEKDWLPSITAIFAITPTLNFRAAYSESLARADFRELTRVIYWDVANRLEVRNDRPLEQSSTKNYDLRLE
jgi:outer membrane receptor protein involved in Fe transport